MVDCIEENYENCLPESIMSELNNSFDVKVKLSSKTVDSSSPATEPSDTEEETFSHFLDKKYLLNALSLNKKTLLLQKKLMNDLSAKDINMIISNLKGHFSSLIIGKHSNYFMTDLIKKATKKQKIVILREVYSQIGKLALNEYGTHPIQTLVERASSKEEITMIINSIAKKNSFLSICTNSNGTFVIQKIISFFSETFIEKLNSLILENILPLSSDIHGVCVIQKFISSCEDYHTLVFLSNIFNLNISFLAENQYSNYAYQCLVKKVKLYPELNELVFNGILSNFIRLSMNQYGNHIVEIFLDNISKNKKKKIFIELSNQGLLVQMYMNKYGKYMINKLLNGFECIERAQFMIQLKQILSE